MGVIVIIAVTTINRLMARHATRQGYTWTSDVTLYTGTSRSRWLSALAPPGEYDGSVCAAVISAVAAVAAATCYFSSFADDFASFRSAFVHTVAYSVIRMYVRLCWDTSELCRNG